MDEPDAIEKDVLNYVNMIIGVDAKNLGPNKIWTYRDPQTNKLVPIENNIMEAKLTMLPSS